MTTDDITFELISVGPPSTGLLTEAAIDSNNQRAIDRVIDDHRIRMRLERLELAEEDRRTRMKRKPKAAKVPAGSGSLTLADVAERLQIDRSTVRRYVTAKKLISSRIGENGPYRFKEGDVQKLLVDQGTPEEKDEALDAFIAKRLMG